jgi:NodT family efflux transporter outer membrane factor (OMF) lipoprotein
MVCDMGDVRKNFDTSIFIIFSILSILLLVSGCTSPPKRSVAPITIPDTFSTNGEVPAEIQWWSTFNDQQLNRFIDTALTNNFSLLATRERIVQAQAIATQAGAVQIPSLDGEGAASTSRNYQTNQNTDTISLGVAASYEIDLWGRLKNKKDAALFELEATKADFQTAQISLSAEVALVWFKITEAEQQLELLRQQKETNEKVLKVITTQFRSGKTDISDVLQQRQLVESNGGSLATLRAEKRVLEHQFSILIGQAPGNTAEPSLDQLPELPPLPLTGLPLSLLTRRPDIKSSFLTLQAADQNAAAAVASRFPRLSLTASLTTSGDTAKDLFSDWFTTLAANLVGPIVDGGYLKAEVSRTESVTRQQLNNYSQTVLDAIGEIENGLVREKELLQSLESEKIQLKLAAETVQNVGNRYRQGVEDYQRVLLALISQQNLQRSILSSRLTLLSNRITLYRALSGPIE